METSKTPVIPIRQAIVNIAGHNVLGVLLTGNRVAASTRMICDLLGVDHRTQIRKILANRAIYDSLLLAQVEIAGRKRVANVIIAEAIPMWLAHIHESKVAPEARETLIEFQRVAVQTLRAFFFPETREQSQSAPPKPEPVAAPIPPPQEPPLSGLDHIHIGIDSIGQKEMEQDARLDRLEKQRAGDYKVLEILCEQISDLMDADGSLAWEHQIVLHTRLKALEHHSGQSRGALERELADTFGVQVIEQLPEASWGRIMAWFEQRLGW
ncbi:MAG TPA: phage antirepressor N-terminal domain-containing protein [Ktedonobacterales bacterium]|jgi:hypothetical protein